MSFYFHSAVAEGELHPEISEWEVLEAIADILETNPANDWDTEEHIRQILSRPRPSTYQEENASVPEHLMKFKRLLESDRTSSMYEYFADAAKEGTAEPLSTEREILEFMARMFEKDKTHDWAKERSIREMFERPKLKRKHI